MTTSSLGEAARGAEPEASAPLLSLVLCSRNDNFQGDSLWRLETTLNHVARQAAELGRLSAIEVIVADWGSDEPLRDAVRLSDDAAQIVRFLTVPVELAKEKQRDSRFAEVFAINAAARRSRGEYVGRIDQDTLVGRHFLAWFFRAVEAGGADFPIDASVMISNRRRIPYHFAVRRPSFPVVERYLSWLDRRLPKMELTVSDNYWECYIGIVLFHRRLWDECGGYDESFIYYSYMEFDLFLRLRMRYQGVDLGEIVDCDFYHLDHVASWLTWQSNNRIENIMRTVDSPPPEFCPSGPDWGLARYPLTLEPIPSRGRGLSARDAGWKVSHWPELLWDSAVSVIGTLGFVVRDQVRLRGRVRGIGHSLIVSTGIAGLVRRTRS